MKKKRIVNGNSTKTDPRAHVESYYLTNAITQANAVKKDSNTPLANEQNVIQAKHFVDENHK